MLYFGNIFPPFLSPWQFKEGGIHEETVGVEATDAAVSTDEEIF